MAKKSGGWQTPDDPAKFMEDYNRRAFLENFPPERRWEKVEGLMFERGQTPQDSLVSISGLDHKGDEVKFWIDLPNAMYLMNMLAHLQRDTQAGVPTEQPGTTKPHP